MKNTEQTIDNNHNGDYEALLKEMQEGKVPMADAEEMQQDGYGLIQPPEVRHTNAAIVASVPNANQIYEKQEKLKGILLDLMSRTNFRSRQELIYFLDYIEWCEDFGVSYDGPMRYCVAINSEGGLARQQYVDILTTYRMGQSRSVYSGNGSRPRPKYKEGELS